MEGWSPAPGPGPGPGVAGDRAAGAILPAGAVRLRDWRRWTGWRLVLEVEVEVELGPEAAVGGWRDDADDAPRRGACFGGMVYAYLGGCVLSE